MLSIMRPFRSKQVLFIWIYLVIVQCNANNEKTPRLEILPSQQILKKPIGKPLLLTCTPNVDRKDLITDLKWRDNNNNTINSKQHGFQPLIYTEQLNVNQLMLVITSLSESMAGNFYCSASYSNSELLEEKVRIETYNSITWKDAPQTQTPIVGEDYVIRCVVTANPPATVDWIREGEQIKSSDHFIIRHDGLLVKNVRESDDGIYNCRAAVIQTGELSERSIRLDVQIKPTLDPIDFEYEAIEGQEFSVKCTGTGKPQPTMQWIKDGKDMALADRFSVVPHNGQMSVTNIIENDRGTYTCIATNAAGYVEQKMQLKVVTKPKIYELKNITIPTGGEGTLLCKARGHPPPQITFRKWGTTHEYRLGHQQDEENVVLEQQVTDEYYGEVSGKLIINNMDRTHDGLYQCLARNKGDTAFEVGHITVEYPPNFDHMKDLPPVYSWEERVANLSCMAMGLPNATIEWRWNERLIREMQDKFLEIVEDGPRSDLLVKPVERRYFTAYKCIAVNRLGRAEHIMELREGRLPPPVAQSKPIEVTATTITFDIIGPASDIGLPTKAFTVQYKEERNPDWSTAFNRTWTVDTPYVVENLQPSKIYTFRFAARNDVGLGQWSAIRIQGTPSRNVPEPPKILNQFVQKPEDGELPIVVSVYPDKFDLMWNRPNDNGEPIDFYSIKFCPGTKINNVWNEVEKYCRDRNYIAYSFSNQMLSELSSDTYYRVELRAHNAIGYSVPTNIYLKTSRGEETAMIGVEEEVTQISSLTIVGIAVLSIILLLIVIDFFCCVALDLGILAALTRKKSDSASRGQHRPLGGANKRGESNNLMVEINSRVRQEDKFDLIGRNSAV